MSSDQVEKQPLLEAQNPAEESTPEPTLAELQQNVYKAQRAYMRAWSRSTSGKWHKRIIFGVTGLLVFCMIAMMSLIASDVWLDDEPYSSGRVPLEAFIMSKCPDARDCLHDMILPAMQNISHKVDFQLSYIGSVTHEDDGVACKHGPSECLGNMLELCAAHYYPNPKIYLGFAMCMSNQYDDIPSKELVEECALEHGMSFDKLHDCTTAEDGGFSVDMLRTSFNRTAALGIEKSCTVTIGNEIFAIRDGGEWKDLRNDSSAASLVDEVNKLYQPPSYADW